jgi:hypothetical protein
MLPPIVEHDEDDSGSRRGLRLRTPRKGAHAVHAPVGSQALSPRVAHVPLAVHIAPDPATPITATVTPTQPVVSPTIPVVSPTIAAVPPAHVAVTPPVDAAADQPELPELRPVHRPGQHLYVLNGESARQLKKVTSRGGHEYSMEYAVVHVAEAAPKPDADEELSSDEESAVAPLSPAKVRERDIERAQAVAAEQASRGNKGPGDVSQAS